MCSVSLPENLHNSQANPDNTSLEGLEGLLDQIFEVPASPLAADYLVLEDAAGASDNFQIATADGEERTVCNLTKHVQPRLHSLHSRKKQVDDMEVLGTKLKLFRARLQFALEELERSRLAEQELRIRLADAEDRLRYYELITDETDSKENSGSATLM